MCGSLIIMSDSIHHISLVTTGPHTAIVLALSWPC